MASRKANRSKGLRQRARQRAAALIAYFETSAFVKLFVDEPGSEATAEAWRTVTGRVSSRLLYPEARAVLAAAERAGRVAQGAEGTRAVLERLWDEVERLGVTPAIARRAGDLAEEHALRGYDAVHLASFEAIADADTLLVTFDDELRTAARALGFPTAPAA